MPKLSSFILDVRNLSRKELNEKYGSFFITQSSEIEEIDDSWSFQTKSLSQSTLTNIRELITSGIELVEDAHQILAYAIQKNKAISNSWQDRITVGRARNNDIIIHDSSISKLHCYFCLEQGSLLVADAGSRNGTRINSKTLGEGDKTSLKSGDSITLGRLSFNILDTESFSEFARSKIITASSGCAE